MLERKSIGFIRSMVSKPEVIKCNCQTCVAFDKNPEAMTESLKYDMCEGDAGLIIDSISQVPESNAKHIVTYEGYLAAESIRRVDKEDPNYEFVYHGEGAFTIDGILYVPVQGTNWKKPVKKSPLKADYTSIGVNNPSDDETFNFSDYVLSYIKLDFIAFQYNGTPRLVLNNPPLTCNSDGTFTFTYPSDGKYLKFNGQIKEWNGDGLIIVSNGDEVIHGVQASFEYIAAGKRKFAGTGYHTSPTYMRNFIPKYTTPVDVVAFNDALSYPFDTEWVTCTRGLITQAVAEVWRTSFNVPNTNIITNETQIPVWVPNTK